MSKLIAISALLCLVHEVVSTDPPQETIFSRVIETRLPNPVTLVMGSELYTISKTNRSLSVNSTDSTCKLSTDPFEENIQGRMRAVAFEKQGKIVVWGIQKSYPAAAAVRRTYYTLLMVEPADCRYKVLQLKVDNVPTGWPELLPQVVPQDDQFYVFYPTLQTCSPCQYYLDGGERNVYNRIQPVGGTPSSQFLIKDYQSSQYANIFFAYNFDNGTSIVKVLDNARFEKGWYEYFDAAVNSASVSYGSYQNTAICSITGKDRREVECKRLTSRLEIGMSWKLPLGSDALPVIDVSVEVDKMGNTFIGVIDSREVRFFVYNVDGLLTADLDFGKFDERYVHREVSGFRLGNEFCLAAVVHADANAQDSRHIVKCTDVSKYIEDSV